MEMFLWKKSAVMLYCCPYGAGRVLKAKKAAGFTTHNQAQAYGCSVPRLTRFAGSVCIGPGHEKGPARSRLYSRKLDVSQQ